MKERQMEAKINITQVIILELNSLIGGFEI